MAEAQGELMVTLISVVVVEMERRRDLRDGQAMAIS